MPPYKYRNLSILEIPLSVLAARYTAMEFQLFSRIRTHEFTSHMWKFDTHYQIQYLKDSRIVITTQFFVGYMKKPQSR